MRNSPFSSLDVDKLTVCFCLDAHLAFELPLEGQTYDFELS